MTKFIAVDNDWFHRLLVVSILALFPFQFLALDVGTTKVDLSNIVFVVLSLSVLFGKRGIKFETSFIIFATAFVLCQIALYSGSDTPFTRFLSGFVWIMSMLVVYGRREAIVIDSRTAYYVVLVGAIVLTLVILYQFRIGGYERPPGTMAEPSPAGLVLLATATGLIFFAQWSKSAIEKLISMGFVILLIYISYMIRTTHILSFVIALMTMMLFARVLNVAYISLIGVILIIIYYVISGDEHYLSRVDVASAASNLSLLSWLQGYDQMVASLSKYPITGAGLGATGFFDFYSEYSDYLFEANIADLNRLDAYSGFFRLVIETGPIFVAAFAYAVWERLYRLWNSVKRGLLPRGSDAKYQMFLFAFGLTLIIGFLLKEPTYSRSQVVVATLLFFAVPLQVRRIARPRVPARPSLAKNGVLQPGISGI